MATYARRSQQGNPLRALLRGHKPGLGAPRLRRSTLFAVITLAALLSFEIFNYSTTEYALTDLFGDLRFADVRWATILALAFCGIDFAGIARLFTPERGWKLPIEVWYLLGAWFLAATMNAMLTWWSVSLALLQHGNLGNEIVTREEMLNGVPIFVAVLVWLIRVLMIGTYTLAGDRNPTRARQPNGQRHAQNQARSMKSQPTVSQSARRTTASFAKTVGSQAHGQSQSSTQLPQRAQRYQ